MLRLVVVAVLVLSSFAAPAGALPAMTFGEALRSAGIVTLPAAWAGVWAYEDTSYACGDPQNFQTDAGNDTLCTGQWLGDNPNDTLNFDCSGSTIDDVSANISCTLSMDFGGCVIDVSISYVATRNGETYFLTATESRTFTPTGCGGADECTVTETTATRIGPEPPECPLTAVDATTWGSVKSRYR
jgi:hypothetical protein